MTYQRLVTHWVMGRQCNRTSALSLQKTRHALPAPQKTKNRLSAPQIVSNILQLSAMAGHGCLANGGPNILQSSLNIKCLCNRCPKHCWCCCCTYAAYRYTLTTNRLSVLSCVHMLSTQLQYIIQLDIADSAERVYANQSGSETAHKSCIKEPPCKCPMGGCRVTESYGLHFCALHAHAFAHGANAPGTLWHRIEQRILIPGPKESNKG